MTRCDYDAVFYRVFCITLLAIAFTFTILLTNVFIDIDGLIAFKQAQHSAKVASKDEIPEDHSHDTITNEDVNYVDNDDSYRTKRSLDKSSILNHIENPMVRNILTNHLTSLLSAFDNNDSNTLKTAEKSNSDDSSLQNNEQGYNKDEDILRLTIQNLFLQGIIGNMNHREVQRRMKLLMNNLNMHHLEEIRRNKQLEFKTKSAQPKHNSMEDQIVSIVTKYEHDQPEEKALNNDDRMNTIKLDDSVVNPREREIILKGNPERSHRNKPLHIPHTMFRSQLMNKKEGGNILLNTVIDIKSLGNNLSDAISKDNINGDIELIFNGQPMKFKRPDLEMKQMQKKSIRNNMHQSKHSRSHGEPRETSTDLLKTIKNIPNDALVSFAMDYFKRFNHENSRDHIDDSKEIIPSKRLKRYANKYKINKELLPHPQLKKQSKDENDLYVEIETHIDSKGSDGEKKKHVINNLIKKIQDAIRSDKSNSRNNIKKKNRRVIVKKRTQNPLPLKEKEIHKEMMNKRSLPLNGVVHRHVSPLVLHRHQPEIIMKDRPDESINQDFTANQNDPKAPTSTENNGYDNNYYNILDISSIPKRLQKPLYTENDEEIFNPYDDYGNMKFFIKDIDGSGFSIGFNQYVDEPPDAEAMKLFTGLENILKSYHQNYDMDQYARAYDEKENIQSRNNHHVSRRSIDIPQYESKVVNIRYENNFSPLNFFKQMFDTDNNYSTRIPDKSTNEPMNDNQFRAVPVTIDDKLFHKNLNPGEILTLADLLKRRKRSVIHVSRHINSKYDIASGFRSPKAYFDDRKRQRRDVNRIRIIASDVPHKHQNDDNLYILSDDNNVASDRRTMKSESTESEPDLKLEDNKYNPYLKEEPDTHISPLKALDRKTSESSLMLKYPHIFIDEYPKSKEEYTPNAATIFGKIPHFSQLTAQAINLMNDPEALEAKTLKPADVTQTQHEESANPSLAKPKYKVTVQIVPKNMSTGASQPDFKEIHTSISKAYKKNGLHYLTLVNVSEISKVTKINKTKELDKLTDRNINEEGLEKKLKEQQGKIKDLLRLHRKNINDQLNQLKYERFNLESILDNAQKSDDTRSDFIKSKLFKQLCNHDVTTTTKASPIFATTPTTIASTTTVAPTTTVASTTQYTTQPTTTTISLFNNETKKNMILDTIERHENLTDQIIKKIDSNTQLLQTFLNKLTEKIIRRDISGEKIKEVKQEIKENKQETAKEFKKNDNITTTTEASTTYPIDIKMNFPIFAILLHKNNSYIPIPIVYAIQPVINQNNETVFIDVKNSSDHEKLPATEPSEVKKPENVTQNALDLDNLYRIIPVSHEKRRAQI